MSSLIIKCCDNSTIIIIMASAYQEPGTVLKTYQELFHSSINSFAIRYF